MPLNVSQNETSSAQHNNDQHQHASTRDNTHGLEMDVFNEDQNTNPQSPDLLNGERQNACVVADIGFLNISECYPTTEQGDDATAATDEDDVSMTNSSPNDYGNHADTDTEDFDNLSCSKVLPCHKGNLRKIYPRTAIALFTIVALFFSVVFIGAEVERKNFEAAPSTAGLYGTESVCARRLDKTFATFDSVDNAHQSQALVAHCGECGACSNNQDINIYNETRDTLTDTTTSCAKKGILFGRSAVESCMEENVGLTAPCQDVWVDDIFCDMKRCIFTCMKSVFLLKESTNPDGTPALNPCLECDEKLCGPPFLEGAGANRRRAGIRSDITRDVAGEAQFVCDKVDPGWMT